MAEHLHLLAKSQGNLTGNGQHMTVADVENALAGTPYLTAPELVPVLEGHFTRGCTVVPDGWVTIVRCEATDADGCVDTLTTAHVFADLRHAKDNGMLSDVEATDDRS